MARLQGRLVGTGETHDVAVTATGAILTTEDDGSIGGGVDLDGAVETDDGDFPIGTRSALVHVLVGTVTIQGRIIAAGEPDWGFFLPPLKTAVPYTISSGGSAHIFVAT